MCQLRPVVVGWKLGLWIEDGCGCRSIRSVVGGANYGKGHWWSFRAEGSGRNWAWTEVLGLVSISCDFV